MWFSVAEPAGTHWQTEVKILIPLQCTVAIDLTFKLMHALTITGLLGSTIKM